MRTNSRIKNYTSYEQIPNGSNRKQRSQPSAGNHLGISSKPDYSSMKMAVQSISDPVPFEFLKIFYGLK